MIKDILIDLEKKLKRYGIIISFTGAFTQGIIEEMGEALKAYLCNKKNADGKVYKIFSIFIELTQNVKNYVNKCERGKVRKKILTSGVVIIGESQGEYFVSSGNLVRNEDVASLKSMINRIQNVEGEELQKLYNKRLRKDSKNESEGAGLGLIDMARKSSRGIDFNFIEKVDDYTFFTITVFV